MGKHMGGLGERVMFWGWFKLFIWRQFSAFHLTSHLALTCFMRLCDLTRGSPRLSRKNLSKMDSSSRVSGSLRTYFGLLSFLFFDP